MKQNMIAPCGMNCGVCYGHLREKNVCSGCNNWDDSKPQYCRKCVIKNCGHFENPKNKFYFNCEKYPCRRLKQLDKRYRAKYGMSMIENLEMIRENGIRAFVKNEKSRWLCSSCGKLISVHWKECINCGATILKKQYD